MSEPGLFVGSGGAGVVEVERERSALGGGEDEHVIIYGGGKESPMEPLEQRWRLKHKTPTRNSR